MQGHFAHCFIPFQQAPYRHSIWTTTGNAITQYGNRQDLGLPSQLARGHDPLRHSLAQQGIQVLDKEVVVIDDAELGTSRLAACSNHRHQPARGVSGRCWLRCNMHSKVLGALTALTQATCARAIMPAKGMLHPS